jgi:hypothetical protein
MILPVLVQNIIEISNVAIEIALVFLYFSLLSKRKISKFLFSVAYIITTVILSAVVLLVSDIFLHLVTTTILISLVAFLCFDD